METLHCPGRQLVLPTSYIYWCSSESQPGPSPALTPGVTQDSRWLRPAELWPPSKEARHCFLLTLPIGLVYFFAALGQVFCERRNVLEEELAANLSLGRVTVGPMLDALGLWE